MERYFPFSSYIMEIYFPFSSYIMERYFPALSWRDIFHFLAISWRDIFHFPAIGRWFREDMSLPIYIPLLTSFQTDRSGAWVHMEQNVSLQTLVSATGHY
jgi:hypothetical protein